MNRNEECLLKFLGQPGRLDKTTAELKRFISYAGNGDFRSSSMDGNIISTKDFLLKENKPA